MDENNKTVQEMPAVIRRLVKVKIRPDWPENSYDAGELPLKRGDWVLVSSGPGDTGREMGQVTGAPIPVVLPSRIAMLHVEGLATEADMEHYAANMELEKRAFSFCSEQVAKLNLLMKLTRVHSLFDGTKIIFYYYAEQRVDFRELVKELVRALRTRVEMRQIGIRHQAKMVGGIGECGREFCCSSYLKTFDPISIKMAKSQNFPLNPNKISGRCGRLLCCLTYEYEIYLNKNNGHPSNPSEIQSDAPHPENARGMDAMGQEESFEAAAGPVGDGEGTVGICADKEQKKKSGARR